MTSPQSSTQSLTHQPRGIIVPLVTPFNEHGNLDVSALQRLIQHVVQGGVDALFVNGTTGEGPSLAADEQRELVRQACAFGGDIPVYVGVTHTSDRETLRLIEHSRDCGATAAVAAPSPYFPAGVREQVACFETLAASSALPIILYNIPQLTKTSISLEAFQEIMGHPRVLGIKDSSGIMVYFRRLQYLAEQRADFSVLIGSDELLAEAILLGAHGGVTGGANIWPRLFSELFQRASAGDLASVVPLQRRVMQLSCTLYTAGNGSYVIQGIKEVLHRKGICGPAMRLPLLRADERLRDAAMIAEELLR